MFCRLVPVAICIFAAGCTVALFEHPLESPDAAAIPPQLFGVYKQVDGPDNVKGYLHVGPAGPEAPAGVFRFLSISQPLDATTSLKVCRGFGMVTRVGEFYVLQLAVHSDGDRHEGCLLDFDVWDQSAVSGFFLARLRFSKKQVELTYIDSGFIEAAINDGRLPGTVKRSEKVHSVPMAGSDDEAANAVFVESRTEEILVTADSSTLRKFLLENIDKELFSDPSLTFKRHD